MSNLVSQSMKLVLVAGFTAALAACGRGVETPEPVEPLAPAQADRAGQAADAQTPAVSTERLELRGEGEVIAETLCSACHAVGAEGDSPHADAPPLRTLSRNYPVEALSESLREGIIVGHPDMPVFQFEPREADALIAYLESIQEPLDL